MKRYNPAELEPKWQKIWEDQAIYEASEDASKPKRYVLEYFPYPSGAAMHVGHVRNYTIGDAIARFHRMQGHNVLHPMGWDAFGLPAENYAIKHSISPQAAIAENTAKFKQQLTQMGFSYDWSREINSSDPMYYKWTQWFFKLLFERGLAYQKESPQWWCDTDKTVLANEQVESGKCWRCGNEVTKKPLNQWFFKITDYADRLQADLEKLDWSESIKSMQRNWIGKSKGAEIDFFLDFGDDAVNSRTDASGKKAHLAVFTTRPDTIFGATYLVLAPEHKWITLALGHKTVLKNNTEVEAYVNAAKQKSDLERQAETKEKTGVKLEGVKAVNPVNGEHIPMFVADYVLPGYGTGAIMAVPAHDERDYEFAHKFELPITRVIKNDASDDECTHAEGVMMNSGEYDDIASEEMREKIVANLSKKRVAEEKVNYKIRDWLISRQRYWGAPIPIIHCDKDGAVAVPDEDLPVKLPDVKNYQPTPEGESVLASVPEWVNTTCPTCGGPAKRETDTMDGFACSSWYFLRFADPKNGEKPFDPEKAKFWLPVDDYIGGAEHAVMHLLYARMWTKVMFDAGLINFDEPFTALRNHGMILAPDGRKMSKSWGNVIAPDDLIADGYGADAIRVMELFIGPWNQQANWSVEGMGGTYRFLQRAWTLTQEYLEITKTQAFDKSPDSEKQLRVAMHAATKRVSEDIRSMGFNTAIAALMEYVNGLYKIKAKDHFAARLAWQEALERFVLLIAPFAPHIADELWQQLGHKTSVHISSWPSWDNAVLAQDTMTMAVQINGKVRGQIEIGVNSGEDEAKTAALANANVKQFVGDRPLRRVVYVPGKILNLVV